MYKKYIKRIVDFVVAMIGLFVLSPVIVVICLWIKLDSKGPILFKQKRVGKDNVYFNILKFRTMSIDTPKDTPTHMLENPDRYITKVGRFLRKTSLDELPQILNIIKGDMAIVGPRPALWNQEDLIELRDKNGSSKIRPGLTGLAQISGRDELQIVVKARLDGEYVKDIRLVEDMRLFLGTFLSVLRSDGVKEGNL